MTRMYTIVLLFVLGCCASTVYAECNASDEISVSIESGWLCGRRRAAEGTTYASFRGVPYAEQPLGKLRFAELLPKVPWDSYYNASEEGAICPQDDVLYGDLVNTNKTMSEECIFANVHVPLVNSTADLSSQSGLPILVFIHGGSFEAGSGDSDVFGPEFLVSKGLIVITFNYRLAVFGFLSLNSTEIPGNAGLRDCITLLNWVRTNAAAFGGNPDDVTLLGHSSGGTQAHLLSLSSAAKGLFKRLIAMSGSAWPSYYSASQAFAQYVSNLFLTQLGINSTDTAYIHKILTEMPLETIMNVNSVLQNQTGLTCFVPCVESSFENITMVMEADPVELMKQGRGKEYPMILGFNEREIYAFSNRLKYLEMTELIKNNSLLVLSPRHIYELSSNVTTNLAAQVEKKYFKAEPTYDEYYVLGSDTFFKMPQFFSAKMRAQSGGADVFLYYFTYESENKFVETAFGISNYTGPVHIEDETNVMRANKGLGDHTSFPPTTTDDHMRDWMTDLVVNFTRCSDPTCSGGTLWKPISNETLYYQLIAAPNVYNNSEPMQDQQDMIALFESLEKQRAEALKANSTS